LEKNSSENLTVHEFSCSDRTLIAAGGIRVELLKVALLVLDIFMWIMQWEN